MERTEERAEERAESRDTMGGSEYILRNFLISLFLDVCKHHYSKCSRKPPSLLSTYFDHSQSFIEATDIRSTVNTSDQDVDFTGSSPVLSSCLTNSLLVLTEVMPVIDSVHPSINWHILHQSTLSWMNKVRDQWGCWQYQSGLYSPGLIMLIG